MTDIDPDREWYYSITVRPLGPLPMSLSGTIEQGDATTRKALVGRILESWGINRRSQVAVHQLERNDL